MSEPRRWVVFHCDKEDCWIVAVTRICADARIVFGVAECPDEQTALTVLEVLEARDAKAAIDERWASSQSFEDHARAAMCECGLPAVHTVKQHDDVATGFASGSIEAVKTSESNLPPGAYSAENPTSLNANELRAPHGGTAVEPPARLEPQVVDVPRAPGEPGDLMVNEIVGW